MRLGAQAAFLKNGVISNEIDVNPINIETMSSKAMFFSIDKTANDINKTTKEPLINCNKGKTTISDTLAIFINTVADTLPWDDERKYS